MSSNPQPDVLQYIIDRTAELDSYTPSQIKAVEELVAKVEKTVSVVADKQKQVIAETNEYERQYTSFLALSISFIVAGLLSALPSQDATIATRVLYLLTIASSLIAALLLATEYIFVQKYFNQWNAKQNEILTYITKGNWKTPDEMQAKVDRLEKKLPKRSRGWILKVELGLIGFSFTTMLLWLIEYFFNPDLWPCF